MSDLINRDALMKYAQNNIYGTVDCNDIARFPTVDAEPVRHGYWIKPTAPQAGIICSACRKYQLVMPSRFCPNCGAKMDKEAQNG